MQKSAPSLHPFHWLGPMVIMITSTCPSSIHRDEQSSKDKENQRPASLQTSKKTRHIRNNLILYLATRLIILQLISQLIMVKSSQINTSKTHPINSQLLPTLTKTSSNLRIILVMVYIPRNIVQNQTSALPLHPHVSKVENPLTKLPPYSHLLEKHPPPCC